MSELLQEITQSSKKLPHICKKKAKRGYLNDVQVIIQEAITAFQFSSLLI
jgi:hypothetical protein